MTRKAATLVEMLIAAAISVIALTAVFSFFSSNLRSYNLGTEHLTNMQFAVLLTNIIENDLKCARPTANFCAGSGQLPDDSIQFADSSFLIHVYGTFSGSEWVGGTVVYEEMNGRGIKRTRRSQGYEMSRNIGETFNVKRVNNEPILQKISGADGKFTVKIQFEVASGKDATPFKVERLVFSSYLHQNAFVKDYLLRHDFH